MVLHSNHSIFNFYRYQRVPWCITLRQKIVKFIRARRTNNNKTISTHYEFPTECQSKPSFKTRVELSLPCTLSFDKSPPNIRSKPRLTCRLSQNWCTDVPSLLTESFGISLLDQGVLDMQFPSISFAHCQDIRLYRSVSYRYDISNQQTSVGIWWTITQGMFA